MKQECIQSICLTNKETILAILKLHIPGKCFDLNPTYSLGKFYKNLLKPIIKGDISPQISSVMKMDSTCLSIEESSIDSIMFDPPFCFGVHGKTLQNISAKRFTVFNSFADLKTMYQNSLKEFWRVLRKKGVLVFKCQDYTDSKTTMTHCLVYTWATEAGFYAKDLFILINKSRIWNPNLKQKHSRKCHSYFWVFIKK